MSSIFHLYRLQQIDSQIDKAQRRLDEIQSILNDDSDLRRVKGRLTKAEEALARAEKKLRNAEQRVESQRFKIKQTEATLYGGSVKNPKEIQDLQNNANSLKRHLSTLEDVQLEAMLEKDEKTSPKEEAANALAALEAKLAQEHSKLLGEQGNLNEEKARLQEERKAALPEITEDELALYNQIRKKKKGVAIAAINGGSCTACGAAVTPAHQQTARSQTKIAYCPSCNRMLYGK